jgi:hypothetical protein
LPLKVYILILILIAKYMTTIKKTVFRHNLKNTNLHYNLKEDFTDYTVGEFQPKKVFL